MVGIAFMPALWPNGKAEARRVGGGFFTAAKLAFGLSR
jgi:hypothetical protein